jgi:hypothetical protein
VTLKNAPNILSSVIVGNVKTLQSIPQAISNQGQANIPEIFGAVIKYTGMPFERYTQIFIAEPGPSSFLITKGIRTIYP